MLSTLEGLLKRAFAATLRALAGSPLPRMPLPESFHRILVIRQHNQLGDMLCAVPLLRALRSRYRSAHIALLTSPVNRDVMLNLRYLDEVICFDKRDFMRKGLRGFASLEPWIRDLRKRRFDLVLVPATVSVSFTSDFIGRLTGAPYRIGAGSLNGVGNPSGFLFNLPIDLDWSPTPHRHQTLRNLDVAKPLELGRPDLSHEMTFTELELSDAKSWIVKRLKGYDLAIGLHPGAGKGPNRWPADRFSKLSDALAFEFGARVFVTAGPMDDAVVSEFLSILKTPVELLQGEPIRTVASRLRFMDLVISNDTGISHVAAAAGSRVLSLFGPTDPEQWAPIGPGNRYIRGKGGSIEAIDVAEVLSAAREIISNSGSVSPGRPRVDA